LQKDLPIATQAARQIVKAVLAREKVAPRHIAIHFVTEERISELHALFFNDPSPTDCISFPIDSLVLGDIFVCPKTAIRYAERHGLDPHEETSLYVVHGILHLLGFDDQDPQARRIMRKKEKSCMAHLKALNLSLRPR
jgi:probable rRNA maturation factor